MSPARPARPGNCAATSSWRGRRRDHRHQDAAHSHRPGPGRRQGNPPGIRTWACSSCPTTWSRTTRCGSSSSTRAGPVTGSRNACLGTGRPGSALTAVAFAGGDFSLQAGNQEFLGAPVLGVPVLLAEKSTDMDPCWAGRSRGGLGNLSAVAVCGAGCLSLLSVRTHPAGDPCHGIGACCP
jgi:hypothetical protein